MEKLKFRLFSPAANRTLSGILTNADHVPAAGYTLSASSVVVIKAVLARFVARSVLVLPVLFKVRKRYPLQVCNNFRIATKMEDQ